MSDETPSPILVYLTIVITLIGLAVLTQSQPIGLTIIFMAILLYGLVAIRNRLQKLGAEAFALGSVLVWLGFVFLALPLIAFAWDLFARGTQIILFIWGIILIIFGYTTEYFELNALFLQWLINTRDRLLTALLAIRKRFLRSVWTVLAMVFLIYDVVAWFNPILIEFLPNPLPEFEITPYLMILGLAIISLMIEFREVLRVLLESIVRFFWYVISAILTRLKRFPDFLRVLSRKLTELLKSMWSVTLGIVRYFRFNSFVLPLSGFLITAIPALVTQNTILGSSSIIFLLLGMSSVVGQRREQIADQLGRVQQAAYSRSFSLRNLVRQSAAGGCPNCQQEVRAEESFCSNCGQPVPTCLVCKNKILAGEQTLACSECGYSGHVDHIESWVNIRPICPNCKTRWS